MELGILLMCQSIAESFVHHALWINEFSWRLGVFTRTITIVAEMISEVVNTAEFGSKKEGNVHVGHAIF